MHIALLLLASGRGTRLGGVVPKTYVPIDGVPLLLRSARKLARVAAGHARTDMVLAVHPDDRAVHLAPLSAELAALGFHTVVDGGETRLDSMARALDACPTGAEVVLVHDAARPFFPVPAAQTVIERAAACGGALLAVPVADTLKQVGGDRRVVRTIDRNGIWLAQTPQAARRGELERGLARARQTGRTATDDSGLLEALGVAVEVVPGSPWNFKVTSVEDLSIAHLLASHEDAS